MTRFTLHPVHVAFALLLALPMLLRADSGATATEKLVYLQPAGVHPQTRINGKPRGGADNSIPQDLALIILSPDHTGLTVQEHPSLFWYLNEPVKGVKYKLTVTSDGEPEPLVEKFLDPEKDTGIQRLNLKDIPKALENNMEYTITVAIIGHGEGAQNVVASGMIKRIAAPEKLVSKLLTRPTPAERAIVYARGGIWWDALAAISDQIAADQNNKELHLERAELFKQVELPQVEAYERNLAK